MATTRIFLVLHGATVLSAEDRSAGSTRGGLGLMLFNDVSHCAAYATSRQSRLSKWWDVDDEGRARGADRAR